MPPGLLSICKMPLFCTVSADSLQSFCSTLKTPPPPGTWTSVCLLQSDFLNQNQKPVRFVYDTHTLHLQQLKWPAG